MLHLNDGERKVSDIIVALENKVNDIHTYIRSIDNNIKFILNKVNSVQILTPPVGDLHKQAKKPTVEAITSIPVSFDENVPKRTAQQQVVVKAIDKPLLMANVEIFNENGVLVKKTKTNQTGRWIAGLPPGNYSVHINKRKSAHNPDVEFREDIKVEIGTGVFELERVEI